MSKDEQSTPFLLDQPTSNNFEKCPPSMCKQKWQANCRNRGTEWDRHIMLKLSQFLEKLTIILWQVNSPIS